MKPLLLIGGILFFLLGLLLFLIAVIVYFVGRSRRNRVAQPAAMPQQAPPPPPPPQPVDATVVLDIGHSAHGAMHGTAGALAGRVFPIEPNGFYVGRDRSMSQVVIDDPRVSKRHVWIGIRDGNVVAMDQSSTNGTYLNAIGPRMTEVRLSPGDTIIISDDVARLTYQR
jgi:hypothetical protein